MSGTLWPVSVKAVVFNARGEVLLLKNPRGEWELPGGRLEPGESPQDCLVREVKEECGLRAVPGRPLSTRVFEVIPGKHVLLVPFLCGVRGCSEIHLSNEHQEGGFFGEDALRGICLPNEYARIIADGRAGHRE